MSNRFFMLFVNLLLVNTISCAEFSSPGGNPFDEGAVPGTPRVIASQVVGINSAERVTPSTPQSVRNEQRRLRQRIRNEQFWTDLTAAARTGNGPDSVPSVSPKRSPKKNPRSPLKRPSKENEVLSPHRVPRTPQKVEKNPEEGVVVRDGAGKLPSPKRNPLDRRAALMAILASRIQFVPATDLGGKVWGYK